MGRIGISIDEISIIESDKALLHVIPDNAKGFYDPFMLRNYVVPVSYLEQSYIDWIRERDPKLLFDNKEGQGVIKQGGYYSIDRKHVFGVRNEAKDEDGYYWIDRENLQDEECPYNDDVGGISLENPNFLNSDIDFLEHQYLYGMNVGQGDMLVFIPSSGNVYIIDCNLYTRCFDLKIEEIKVLLNKLGLNSRKIKGLLITHKHLDHIRGANKLISCGEFEIDNLIMNFSYSHPTKPVQELISTAKKFALRFVDINMPIVIKEGSTIIEVLNPTAKTLTASDINDSSVVIRVIFKQTQMYLTGDARHTILTNVYNGNKKNKVC